MRHEMKNALAVLILGIIVVTNGCAGSSEESSSGATGETPESGSGTQSDPYVISVGTTYKGSIGAMSTLSGEDIWYQFQATVTGFYTGSLTNTSTDLALDFYDNSQNF